MPRDLNDRQMAFAEQYALLGNATQAAIAAGYAPKTAGQIGHRLLKNVEIAKRIEATQAAALRRVHITQDMVLEGLLTEARYQGEGSSHGARVSAWTQLARTQGMLTDKQEQTGPNGGPVIHEIRHVIVDPDPRRSDG